MSGRKKSCIWEFFKKEQSGTVQCLLCKKNVCTKGNTSNLHAHLKHKHPLQFRAIEENKRRAREKETEIGSEDEARYKNVLLVCIKPSIRQPSKLGKLLKIWGI